MAKQTFIWFPDAQDWVSDESPEIYSIKFGDGYEQRIEKGINSNPKRFDLSFSRNLSEISAIRIFLRDHGGVDSFIWVNPFSETGFYVAKKWSVSKTAEGIYSLKTKFEEVFD